MQSKSRITVVSEGRVFCGVRTPLAFTWVEASESATSPRRSRPFHAPDSNLVYVFVQMAKLKLAKHDLALRRQQAAALSRDELEQLVAKLRAAAKAPGPARSK